MRRAAENYVKIYARVMAPETGNSQRQSQIVIDYHLQGPNKGFQHFSHSDLKKNEKPLPDPTFGALDSKDHTLEQSFWL